MPFHELEQIVNFIELMLNKPIIEMLINKIKKNKKSTKKSRKRIQTIEAKTFFSSIFSDIGFIYVPDVDEHLENLPLLTDNRYLSDIFLVTSQQFQIISAMHMGFCAIPVIKFRSFMQNDY